MPDSLLQRTLTKIRYYKHGVPWYGFLLRVSIDTVSKLGLRIEPFHLYLEGLGRCQPPSLPRGLEQASISFLTPEDMAEVASLPGRQSSPAQLQDRLRAGRLCLGVKHHGKIVAFTWCSLSECHIEKRHLFDLEPGEASLFDAYTAAEYRGQQLAPWIRYRCYEELAKLGRTRCYSVTIAFNTPAIRFKQKLGAEVSGRGVYVDLLARHQFHLGGRRP
jgi:GNAT superfamily N-acetyltransferase